MKPHSLVPCVSESSTLYSSSSTPTQFFFAISTCNYQYALQFLKHVFPTYLLRHGTCFPFRTKTLGSPTSIHLNELARYQMYCFCFWVRITCFCIINDIWICSPETIYLEVYGFLNANIKHFLHLFMGEHIVCTMALLLCRLA